MSPILSLVVDPRRQKNRSRSPFSTPRDEGPSDPVPTQPEPSPAERASRWLPAPAAPAPAPEAGAARGPVGAPAPRVVDPAATPIAKRTPDEAFSVPPPPTVVEDPSRPRSVSRWLPLKPADATRAKPAQERPSVEGDERSQLPAARRWLPKRGKPIHRDLEP